MQKVLMVWGLMCWAEASAAQPVVDQWEDDKFVGEPQEMPSVQKYREVREAEESAVQPKEYRPLGVEENNGDGPTVYKAVGVDEVENPITTVEEAKKFRSSVKVIMEGEIIRHISAEMYEFRDQTGMMIVRINKENWKGVYWDGFKTYPDTRVKIEGWIERGYVDGARIDVDAVYGGR